MTKGTKIGLIIVFVLWGVLLFWMLDGFAADRHPALYDSDALHKMVKYRVEFTVVYNAVEAYEASRLVQGIMLEHKDACKVKVTTKKVGSEGGSQITFSTGVVNGSGEWLTDD